MLSTVSHQILPLLLLLLVFSPFPCFAASKKAKGKESAAKGEEGGAAKETMSKETMSIESLAQAIMGISGNVEEDGSADFMILGDSDLNLDNKANWDKVNEQKLSQAYAKRISEVSKLGARAKQRVRKVISAADQRLRSIIKALGLARKINTIADSFGGGGGERAGKESKEAGGKPAAGAKKGGAGAGGKKEGEKKKKKEDKKEEKKEKGEEEEEKKEDEGGKEEEGKEEEGKEEEGKEEEEKKDDEGEKEEGEKKEDEEGGEEKEEAPEEGGESRKRRSAGTSRGNNVDLLAADHNIGDEAHISLSSPWDGEFGAQQKQGSRVKRDADDDRMKHLEILELNDADVDNDPTFDEHKLYQQYMRLQGQLDARNIKTTNEELKKEVREAHTRKE